MTDGCLQTEDGCLKSNWDIILLLKDDRDVQGFQLPVVIQRVQRVSGEARNRLRYDKVD